MVYRRTKVSRSTFRNLPLGAIFYPSSEQIFPLVKCGRNQVAASPGFGAVYSPLDDPVVRVPDVFLKNSLPVPPIT